MRWLCLSRYTIKSIVSTVLYICVLRFGWALVGGFALESFWCYFEMAHTHKMHTDTGTESYTRDIVNETKSGQQQKNKYTPKQQRNVCMHFENNDHGHDDKRRQSRHKQCICANRHTQQLYEWCVAFRIGVELRKKSNRKKNPHTEKLNVKQILLHTMMCTKYVEWNFELCRKSFWPKEYVYMQASSILITSRYFNWTKKKSSYCVFVECVGYRTISIDIICMIAQIFVVRFGWMKAHVTIRTGKNEISKSLTSFCR